MPLCFICKKDLPSVRGLLLHFTVFHPNHKFDRYTCAEDNCNRTYSLRNSFLKHLKSHQPFSAIINEFETATDIVNDVPPSRSCSETETTMCNSNESGPYHQILLGNNGNGSIVPFLASLYANPLLPRNTVQNIVEGMDEFLKKELSSSIRKICSERMTESITTPEMLSLLNDIQVTIRNPLDKFMTEHKRIEFFKSQGTYIAPIEIVIGQRLSDVKRKGVHSLEPCVCTEQMIPLRQILKSFLSLNNVLTELLEYKKHLEENKGFTKNIIQGSVWKSKNMDNNVLPFFLFYDDFESGNVLGSHSGTHKLGAVYISLACMPPHMLSSLSNLFLAMLFHSSDRTNFGNKAIFSPLIAELNYLKQTGITLETPEFTGTLYFELALILGDNLGLHSIIGFCESFSSNYPCRICKVEKGNLKSMCYEDHTLIRKICDYEEELKLGNVSLTGIKERCVWLDIEGFSLYDQVGVDLMHDFLEGCLKYILLYIFNAYTKDLQFFSLAVLNSRIFGFNYGPDSASKPVELNYDNLNSGNLRLSAAEVLTLTKYLGVLVGDFIPVNEPSWDLYIVTRKVLDILVSPTADKERTDLLRTLVAELNELFMKFSKQSLKPKFHFLTHYPTIIEKFGPVIHFWSMRYEAKHRVSKIAARSSCNKINLCKTLATKHQLQLNETFIKGNFAGVIQTGPEKDIDLDLHEDIEKTLKIDLNLPLVSVSWASVKGTLYKTGSIITGDSGYEDQEETFLLVQEVFLYNLNLVVFQCQKFKTLGFDEHFFAFEVISPSIMDDVVYMFQHSLVSHIPHNLTNAPNGKKYIILRG